MADEYVASRRCPEHPVVRSMLLSSSFAWTRRDRPYPIYVPPPLSGLLPLPMSSITPRFAQQHKDRAFGYVQGVVDRQIQAVEHPYHKEFVYRCADLVPKKLLTERKNVLPIREPFVETCFDPKSFATKVTIYSLFENVRKTDADKLLKLATPPHWADASNGFFKRCEPGTFVGGVFKPDPDPALVKEATFLIREYVEWNWSPDIPAGGMVNVLEISKKAGWTLADAQEHVKDVAGKINAAQDPKGKFAQFAPERLNKDNHKLVAYDYKLNRCIQSKFISNWESGGIDVDDGEYKALWCRTEDDLGTLYVKVDKMLHYTTQADVIPGLSMLLNALSPAILALFMRQLAFDSTRDLLEHRAGTGPAQAIES